MMRLVFFFAATCFFSSPLAAQNILQFLSRAEPAKHGGPQEETTAVNQLPWARDQAAAATQAQQNFDPEAFKEHLTLVGLPEDRVNDMASALAAAARNYATAVEALTNVIENRRLLDEIYSKPPPQYPTAYEAVEELRSQIADLHGRLTSQDTQLSLDEGLLQRQRQSADDAQRTVRRLQQDLDSASPTDKARAALLLQLAEKDALAKSSAVFLTAWRVYGDRLERDATAAEMRAAQRVLEESGLDTLFNLERSKAMLAQNAEETAAVEAKLGDARELAATVNAMVLGLRGEDGSPPKDKEALDTAVEAASLADRLVRGYELWLAGLTEQAECWQAIKESLENPKAAQPLETARDKAKEILSLVGPLHEQQTQNARDSARRLAELEALPQPASPAAREAFVLRLDIARQRDEQLRQLGIQAEGLSNLASRLNQESQARLAVHSIAARATSAFDKVLATASAIWDTELFTAKENILTRDGVPVVRERPITLGKLTIAFAVVIGALLLSRLTARWVGHNLRTRLSAGPAKVQMIERALFMLLAAIVVLTALNWLQIPLTAFAFLGGALAIGLGFGAQTLMNNFISGLILTAEQRIKVGDIIEVDSRRGRVLSLGTRCALVQQFDGVELLVPNSYLLEKNVTNWTLADPLHRYDFVVGVAYGSDTRAVLSLLEQCIKDQPEVLKSPAPAVFFEEFADSSLNFRLYYWLDVRLSDARKVGSEMRLRIDERCRAAGIEIAFPQRDIHLHTSKPLQVEIARHRDRRDQSPNE